MIYYTNYDPVRFIPPGLVVAEAISMLGVCVPGMISFRKILKWERDVWGIFFRLPARHPYKQGVSIVSMHGVCNKL